MCLTPTATCSQTRRSALRYGHQPASAGIRVLGPGWAAGTEPIVQAGPRLLAASAVPGLTFVRVDDTILIVLALPSLSSLPTIRINRQHDDGFFDKLVDGFETLWNTIPSTDTTPLPTRGSDAPSHSSSQPPSHAAGPDENTDLVTTWMSRATLPLCVKQRH